MEILIARKGELASHPLPAFSSPSLFHLVRPSFSRTSRDQTRAAGIAAISYDVAVVCKRIERRMRPLSTRFESAAFLPSTLGTLNNGRLLISNLLTLLQSGF